MSAPILALDKVSKHFGAIVVADRLDLALAEKESLGEIAGSYNVSRSTISRF